MPKNALILYNTKLLGTVCFQIDVIFAGSSLFKAGFKAFINSMWKLQQKRAVPFTAHRDPASPHNCHSANSTFAKRNYFGFTLVKKKQISLGPTE